MLGEHPEIKFVSPVGIDLEGNYTDEKIPVKIFIKDIDEYIKVDIPIDANVNWFVDYNYEHFHEGKRVDSRAG